MRMSSSAVWFVALTVIGLAGSAQGTLIGAWSPDDLTAGPAPTNITSMTDDSGHGNTLGGNAFPTLYGPNTVGYNTVFHGRQYANYDPSVGPGQGLITNNLYSGAGTRTVVTVYSTPSVAAPAGGTNGTVSGFNAGIAGEASVVSAGTWFGIEARDNNVTGSPYLVGDAADVNSGVAPAANVLTFAIATYDGTTENLYWAFGVNGTVASNSHTIAINTTSTGGFLVGENLVDNAHSGEQIGQILVFNTALSASAAAAEIAALQGYYNLPEPSTFVLAGFGLVGLLVAGRRGRQVRRALYQNRVVVVAMIALALLAPSAFATPVTIDADTHTPVGVTASSFLPGPIFDRSPEHTIDNSGLTGNAHATGSADGTMWTSNGNGLGLFTPDYAPSITFDLGRILNVSAMDIWNYNESGPGFPNNPYLGAESVQVLAGATLGTLTNVGAPVTFAEATGLATYTGDVMPLVMNAVQFIEFKILTTWEGATFGGTAGTSTDPGPDGRFLTGLSEVKFEATTPEPSTFILAGIGLVGLMVARRRRK